MTVNFSFQTNIAPLIGFYNNIYPAFEQAILINCSIAFGSYSAQGRKGQTIYSFSPDVPPGSIMQISPSQVIYYPINLENQITSITMQLTDQSGRQINLNNEIVRYYLHLRIAQARNDVNFIDLI